MGRVLNGRGQNVHTALSGFVGTLFVIVMILYAGFRGSRAATQLPATFTTTTPPRSLPYEFMTRIFPDNVPSQTFEFPSLTVCPETPGTIITINQCYVKTTNGSIPCDAAGIYVQNTTNFDGVMKTCGVVNDAPGLVMSAGSEADVLYVAVQIANVSSGSPSGVLVNAHPAGLAGVHFDSYFAASAFTYTEVALMKIYRVDINQTVTVDYAAKPNYMHMNVPITTGNGSMPFELEFRYPKLEYTYERTFFPLDANNWLGEVGGVAALLLFLHRAVMQILVIAMCRTDRYSFTRVVGKNEEGFERF
ncbi:hypothetical protein SeMB42_g03872 [Synchytrium endobioticum]|uniref:Uncharacterized protein n=1 Tax=Synchytrium endobioticum TaxID=286115 RepID=A0A507D3M2_9FUNG|nr:hypothetical protein SeMB42_g03872 [Synchytrium endobioticum]TPX47969.1 hypothetical protein SeLEV6574_g02323 [Synchytrium endobioticum]